MANARANLAKARADRGLKAVTLGRQRELRGQGIVSQSEFDTAESESQQAEAQIALDEAGVHTAEAGWRRRASISTTPTSCRRWTAWWCRATSSVGQTVAATFQTPTLFLVATDLMRMQVNASVSESDIGGVAVGQAAAFTVDAYPGTPFEGRVSQVRNAPVTVQNVVTYDVLIAVDNPAGRLKPGMTANVTITTATREDAVRVPTAALRFRPPADATAAGANAAAPPVGRHAVWVLGAGDVLRPVEVETGIADERFTQITGGLAEGDRVVTGVVRAAQADAVPPRSPFMPSVRGRR